MSRAELLGLTVREAVDQIWEAYVIERHEVYPDFFDNEELRMQFVALLFETSRCLLEHIGICKVSRCGRHFHNIDNVMDVLTDIGNGDKMDNNLVESAREFIWNVSLEEAVNRAVERAFSGWYPISHLVEVAYGKCSLKDKMPDLLWAFCRTADEGPGNALLAVGNILNSVLDGINSNEQFHLDLLFHRSTGKLPTWLPFQEPAINLRIAALNLSPIQELDSSFVYVNHPEIENVL